MDERISPALCGSAKPGLKNIANRKIYFSTFRAAASYTSKEVSNEEEPVLDMLSLPTEESHRMPDGTIHPIQVGLRMVEEFRSRCKESVEADPLQPVAVVYEAELTRIKNDLEGNDLEEFTALCPTLQTLSPSLYRCHHHHHNHQPN